jgi:hypothetical protein
MPPRVAWARRRTIEAPAREGLGHGPRKDGRRAALQPMQHHHDGAGSRARPRGAAQEVVHVEPVLVAVRVNARPARVYLLPLLSLLPHARAVNRLVGGGDNQERHGSGHLRTARLMRGPAVPHDGDRRGCAHTCMWGLRAHHAGLKSLARKESAHPFDDIVTPRPLCMKRPVNAAEGVALNSTSCRNR